MVPSLWLNQFAIAHVNKIVHVGTGADENFRRGIRVVQEAIKVYRKVLLVTNAQLLLSSWAGVSVSYTHLTLPTKRIV